MGATIRLVSSTYISINTHFVFSTKGRAPMVDKAWRGDLHAYITGTCRGLGAVSLAVNGVEDHVHLLAGLRATHRTADFVREIKKASSAWAAERNPGFSWQAGYAGFSISQSDVPSVVAYIDGQEEHHRHISSVEELRALPKEFAVAYDERYFE